MSPWHHLVVGFGVVATAAAQRTWIVDAANGPGTHFTDIPPAVAAAVDGDTLLVRSGTYTPFTTNKGIAVLGTPSALVQTPSFFPGIMVSGLPAGAVFRARGLVLGGTISQTMSLNSNEGAVHLEAIESAGGPFPQPNAAIGISSSRLVTIVDCGQRSILAVNVASSRVSIVHSQLRGRSAFSDPRAGSWPATSALSMASGSVVDVADCTLLGGRGASIWPHVGTYWSSAPAINLSNLFGDPTLRLRAGTVGSASSGIGINPATPMSAIAGIGVAQVDSRVALASYAGAPLIDPGVRATIGLVPGLSLVGGGLGSNLVLTHHGQANQPCLAGLGVVGTVLSFPFGDLVLDLATMQTLPLVFADGSGVATWTVPLPNNPTLAGAAFTWQVGSDAGGLMLSNAVSVILR